MRGGLLVFAGGAELELFELAVLIQPVVGLGLEVLVGFALAFRVQPELEAADVFVSLDRRPVPGVHVDMLPGCRAEFLDGAGQDGNAEFRERVGKLLRGLVDFRRGLRARGCGTGEQQRGYQTEGKTGMFHEETVPRRRGQGKIPRSM